MNWELAASDEAHRVLNRCLLATDRKGTLDTLRQFAGNPEVDAAIRYLESRLDDGPLVRN